MKQIPAPPSDANLPADPRALFVELFDDCAQPLYNYCFRRVGDWATAEDLVSAVFLEAWRRRAEAELYRADLRPWLFGVANNMVRNVRRSLRRHQSALERLGGLRPLSPDLAENVASSLDDQRRMREVLALLRKLPVRDQEVLGMCVWGELSYEEAAVALHLPVGTVRSRMSRAREHLRQLETDSAGDQ